MHVFCIDLHLKKLTFFHLYSSFHPQEMLLEIKAHWERRLELKNYNKVLFKAIDSIC